MQDSNDQARRRPVDALFGSDAASAAPQYIVEAPQPPTTVNPPPPEMSLEDAHEKSPAVPAPARLPEANVVASPPVIETEQYVPQAAPARTEDPRFLTLSFQIERLYEDVKTELRDSSTATNYCFDLLLQARQAYERRDYASAEFFAQSADAKVKRSVKSMEGLRSPTVILVWVWELFALLIAGAMIALTYVVNLTLFGLPVAPEFIILLRSIGWGIVGGVLGAIYNLPWFVQFREYDPAYNMDYFSRPFKGLLVGAVLYLVSQAGILAGNVALGDAKLGPIFLYVVAALAGFKQEYVTEFFDSLLKAIFRVPTVPSGLKSPKSS